MVINCKKIANELEIKSKMETENLRSLGIIPKLSIISVGDDEASKIYINSKTKACERAGICTEEIALNKNTSEKELINIIDGLNKDRSITGILVQLPLPDHIDENKVAKAIDPQKDVDGLNPINMGNLISKNNVLIPCTACAIMKVLKHEKIEISGKNCVVVGRSKIVGKPTAALMLNHDATVTVCHSKTENLKSFCQNADILISATGKPSIVTSGMVKPGAVVIDVGINRSDDGRICGDVDFEGVSPIASYITPVPGGIGPITVAMLVQNTILSAKLNSKIK